MSQNTVTLDDYFPTSPFQTLIQRDNEDAHDIKPIEDVPTKTESDETILFIHKVLRFHNTIGQERHNMRSEIIRKIRTSDSPSRQVNDVLNTLVISALPSRLDDAIDILSAIGNSLSHAISIAIFENKEEDYWYVLVRAIGKSRLPNSLNLITMLWNKSPEAAIEALGDIGDDKSLGHLQELASNENEPEFLRELAREIFSEHLD